MIDLIIMTAGFFATSGLFVLFVLVNNKLARYRITMENLVNAIDEYPIQGNVLPWYFAARKLLDEDK